MNFKSKYSINIYEIIFLLFIANVVSFIQGMNVEDVLSELLFINVFFIIGYFFIKIPRVKKISFEDEN